MKRQTWSGMQLLWRSIGRHRGWQEQWRRAEPKASYDAIIVGGGGHGLGTAYYLAAEHGLTNIAVVEKGWIGGGNTGRNTTIIRSNYLFDESARLYDHAVHMWEHLSQDLNYNVMFSPRGVMMLAHTVHDVQVLKRHVHANRCNGVDNEWLTPPEAKAFCPPLNIEANIRYPVLGAALQRRAHDRVADVAADLQRRAEGLRLFRCQPLVVHAVGAVGVHDSLHHLRVVHVVREHHHATRRVHDVVVEVLREALPQLQCVLVDRDAFVEQVVRADDGRVAAGVAAADPALLDHRDVGEAVMGREVVRRAESVAPAADDDRVVRGLRLGLAPLLAPVAVLREAPPQQRESRPGLTLQARNSLFSGS